MVIQQDVTQVKAEEPTIGKLVADASRDVSSLISSEIKLAKSEIKVSLKTGGIGAALLGAAAFLLLIAVILLSVTVAYFINWDDHGLSLKYSFLIVTAFYVLVAVVLALLGIRKLKKVRGPERAVVQAKETKLALTKRG